jgi:hypothetical protein
MEIAIVFHGISPLLPPILTSFLKEGKKGKGRNCVKYHGSCLSLKFLNFLNDCF